MAKDHTRYCGLVLGPHLGRITVSGISNCPNYCEIFKVYAQFTVVSTGRMIPPGGLRVGDAPCNPERTKIQTLAPEVARHAYFACRLKGRGFFFFLILTSCFPSTEVSVCHQFVESLTKFFRS